LKRTGLLNLFFKVAEAVSPRSGLFFLKGAGFLFLFALYWVSPGFDSLASFSNAVP
jgi:hypothetical protein